MSAHMKQHNGTPTMFMDGVPSFAGYMWATGARPDQYEAAAVAKRYAEAGIHLYAFDVGTQGVPPEWRGPEEGRSSHWDFSTVEARFGHMLDADPDARFHLRVHLEMGGERTRWWRELYPEECELGSDGTRLTQSFASTIWREQAKAFLRAYAAHFQSIGLGDRVIAYQTGAGGTGEWVKGDSSMDARCGDYSGAMQQHFRAWLRREYGGEVAALQDAWADASVSFGTAAVPSALDQLETKHQTFRDPRQEQNVIDYYRCLAELCGDLVIDFNRTVKEATDGQALAGAFFGYLLELAWNKSFFGAGDEGEFSTSQRSGHLGLGRILRSPHVDFIVSPYSYGFRGIGGEGSPMPPTESARLHGKLYIFEEDSRTYLNDPDVGYGRVGSLSDSVAVLQRNLAQVVTRGLGIWWLGGSPQHPHINPEREPAFRPVLKRFQELGTFALELDRTPSAEIAVLLDDESFFYESVHNELDLPLIFQQRLWGLPKLGAPADYYLLDDLLEGRLRPYKLYVFLNPFRLGEGRREALAKELRRDGRVALWIYAPGYIKDEPGLEHMTDVTGFRFAKGEHAWGPLMHILDFQHPITDGLPQDLFWGTNSRLGPVFHLDDPEAQVLGQVVYSQGRCQPGLGVKEFDDWTSIYVAAPNIPAPVLRGIARYAGVHLYNEEGDVLYATPQLLGVHTIAGGKRTFSLPQKVEAVYELFSQKAVAQNTDRFEVVLSPASTELYYTGVQDLLRVLSEFSQH